jgi:hypothetical protein
LRINEAFDEIVARRDADPRLRIPFDVTTEGRQHAGFFRGHLDAVPDHDEIRREERVVALEVQLEGAPERLELDDTAVVVRGGDGEVAHQVRAGKDVANRRTIDPGRARGLG